MATITRDAIVAVALPSEAVDVPSIGGTVLVRGMTLPQLLAFRAAGRRISEPQPGEDAASAQERASGELVPLLLSTCVVLDDGLPVYSATEWAAWGTQHPAEALDLWQRAIALSGADLAAEKKT